MRIHIYIYIHAYRALWLSMFDPVKSKAATLLFHSNEPIQVHVCMGYFKIINSCRRFSLEAGGDHGAQCQAGCLQLPMWNCLFILDSHKYGNFR